MKQTIPRVLHLALLNALLFFLLLFLLLLFAGPPKLLIIIIGSQHQPSSPDATHRNPPSPLVSSPIWLLLTRTALLLLRPCNTGRRSFGHSWPKPDAVAAPLPPFVLCNSTLSHLLIPPKVTSIPKLL